MTRAWAALKFYDDAPIDPQISTVLPNNLTVIGHIDRFLLFDFQSQSFELNSKRILIYLLEKAGAESVVNFVCATDDFLCEVIVFHEKLRQQKRLDRIYRIDKIICDSL